MATSDLVSIALTKHYDQKQQGEKNGLFHLTILRSQSITKGNQGRRLDVGADDVEAMQESCSWLALQGLLACFLITPGHQPMGSTAVQWWVLFHQLSIKKMPHKLPYRGIFSICISSSQICLDLTKNKTKNSTCPGDCLK